MKYIFYCYLYESGLQHRSEIDKANSLEQAKKELKARLGDVDFDIIMFETA